MSFKKGDTPAPGLKILNVIRGDAKDSFDHYVYSYEDLNGQIQEFESKVAMRHIEVMAMKKKYLLPIDEVRIVGNPDAACVQFHIDGEMRNRSMKPAEFDEFLEEYKQNPVEVKEPMPPAPVLTDNSGEPGTAGKRYARFTAIVYY